MIKQTINQSSGSNLCSDLILDFYSHFLEAKVQLFLRRRQGFQTAVIPECGAFGKCGGYMSKQVQGHLSAHGLIFRSMIQIVPFVRVLFQIVKLAPQGGIIQHRTIPEENQLVLRIAPHPGRSRRYAFCAAAMKLTECAGTLPCIQKIFPRQPGVGLNACRGAATPLVNITGGYLDVTTQSGDTDGVDSNGNITISGGFTIVKGGSSQGGMAGSVDVDGSIKMTGGTVVALGGICETPSASGSSVNTYVSTGSVFEKGTYSLKDAAGNEILSFSLAAPYYSIWIASDGLTLNGEYSLVAGDGVALLSWKQSSSTVGASGSGWGNPGGPGGWGGGSHGGPGGGGHGGRP